MKHFIGTSAMLEVEMVTASPELLLKQAADRGIEIYQSRPLDPLTWRFRIKLTDMEALVAIAQRHGAAVRTVARRGIYWKFRQLLRHRVLLAGAALVLLLAAGLPTRVLFVTVEGNVEVPSRQILAEAAGCGVSFGAARREIRSEQVKNALLSAIPQLQWAGINTRGCTAVISVREKADTAAATPPPAVSSIVSVRDAVITGVTAEQGNVLCRVGQAVRKGDLLVSGYTDCGLTVRATRSVGEVFGLTRRNLTVIFPKDAVLKREKTGTQKKFGLILGKKRINFYNDSGILGATCDKMSKVNYIMLPGGFALPIALVTEVWTEYSCTAAESDPEQTVRMLETFAGTYLHSQMVAGEILGKRTQMTDTDAACTLIGEYACLELVGREQSEEILDYYGKND